MIPCILQMMLSTDEDLVQHASEVLAYFCSNRPSNCQPARSRATPGHCSELKACREKRIADHAQDSARGPGSCKGASHGRDCRMAAQLEPDRRSFACSLGLPQSACHTAPVSPHHLTFSCLSQTKTAHICVSDHMLCSTSCAPQHSVLVHAGLAARTSSSVKLAVSWSGCCAE